MKNTSLLFMLLIILVNCDTRKLEEDYNKEIDRSNLLYSLISTNKMKKVVVKKRINDCGIDCIKFESNYSFNDSNSQNCGDFTLNGDNNNKPDKGENGILRIPIFYTGGYDITNIEVELISKSDTYVGVYNPIISYSDLIDNQGFQVSCPSNNSQGVNDSKDISCKEDTITGCIGWRLSINSIYPSKYNFEIIFRASMVAFITDYSL